MSPVRVCILGSGNWGSAIARLVGYNASRLPNLFHKTVNMWVFEETLNDGRRLTEVINSEHVNVKYLPNHALPDNIVAIPDIVEAASEADFLVCVVPHQFVEKSLQPLVSKIKPGAKAVSLIKGFSVVPSGGIRLISNVISETLGIPVSVLMGANLAQQVADEEFCETTIGCKNEEDFGILKCMFETSNFRVVVVSDAITVEVCGALKNIIAVGAGIVDGLKLGHNTKAAVIRLGLMEMIKYVELFYPDSKKCTFFESCGVADLVTTCYGGRNRRIAEQFVLQPGASLDELERDLLGGQKLQGPETAREVNFMLKQKNMDHKFPLFTAIHRVCIGEISASVDFIETLRTHPEHM